MPTCADATPSEVKTAARRDRRLNRTRVASRRRTETPTWSFKCTTAVPEPAINAGAPVEFGVATQ
ncbi:MAG: hypothetical protein R3F49_07890 [Planctomycetota bacterium]